MPSTCPKPASRATCADLAEVRLPQDGRVAERGPDGRAIRAMAAGSASMPSRRPPGVAASRIRRACPPPPSVASIWKLPATGESAVMTSSTITGRCPSSTFNYRSAAVPSGSRRLIWCGARCRGPGGVRRAPRACPSGRCTRPSAWATTAPGGPGSRPPRRLPPVPRTSRRTAGTTTRPCRSRSASKAVPKTKRTKVRAPASVMGSVATRSASASQAARGWMARQPSIHLLTSAPPASSARKRAGTATRPLSSTAWWYSPVNTCCPWPRFPRARMPPGPRTTRGVGCNPHDVGFSGL